MTQQQLLKDIWGPTHVEDTHYLRVVVGHLRQKLGDDPASPRFLVTGRASAIACATADAQLNSARGACLRAYRL